MKKLTIAAIIIGFIAHFAHAQTGDMAIEVSDHFVNDCMVTVDTWSLDPDTGAADTATEGYTSTVTASVLPGSWLYYVKMFVSFHFHQNYAGRVTLLIDNYAASVLGAEHDTYTSTYDFQEGTFAAEGEAHFVYTRVIKMSGVWDRSPGTVILSETNLEILETIPGFLRVDMVQVKRWDGSEYCPVH